MHRIKIWLTACLAFLLFSQIALARTENPPDTGLSSIREKTRGLDHLKGFIDLYWDRQAGRLFLQIDTTGGEFIYQSSLARGVGSNDLGLDRGQLGATRLVEFYRFGPKVLMMEKNTGFRADTDDEAEQQAVENSFAPSVMWGFEIAAETGDSVLVDATDFFLRDAHDISTRLSRAQQGSYKTDPSRSAIFMPRTKAFPDNTEIEAVVSYTGEQKFDDKGKAASDLLASVIPDTNAFTVHLHHSFIRLPDDGYEPLPYDPRAGIIGAPWSGVIQDYATPVGTTIMKHFGMRHRLKKLHPAADVSEAVEPIVYYLDPGVPEPIRSALLDGAGWWNQAFEAAGYKDAFQVRMLPADADPMDVRYNVIQWVHRSTRGWSYGSSIVDPRTGEILKGHVTLGSLRVRQDYLIAEGLLAPYVDGQVPDTMLELSLARIRQLAAHEVGHTLGMEHNFAASVDNRSSVMDYPFPLVQLDANGGLDFSEAYTVGIGEWDKRTVLYAYQDFPGGIDPVTGRQKILDDTIASGLHYVADEDSRDPGAANPLGNLWDNGADAITELERLLKVRAYALDRFSQNNIRPGQPLATLEEVLVPIYLLHRYQVEAVAKLVGGQYFTYELRGDGQPAPRAVEATKQEAAVTALVDTLDPQLLRLPQTVVELIPPRPPGFPLDRETFSRSTGITFDPLSPAQSAVSLTLDVLLNRQRSARMNVQHALDAALPDFSVVLAALDQATWYAPRQNAVDGAIQRQTADAYLHQLMDLATDPQADTQVQAQAFLTISHLGQWLDQQNRLTPDGEWTAFYARAQHAIAMMLTDPDRVPSAPAPAVPPGSPIGSRGGG